jgi:hypothetical protein
MPELLVPLNNPGNDWVAADSMRLSDDDPTRWNLCFKYKHNVAAHPERHMVRIEPGIGDITTYVIAAHPAVQSRDHLIWTSELPPEANMIGSRRRALKKLHPDISIRFRATFQMVQSSKEFFQKGLNLLWDKSQFSAEL